MLPLKMKQLHRSLFLKSFEQRSGESQEEAEKKRHEERQEEVDRRLKRIERANLFYDTYNSRNINIMSENKETFHPGAEKEEDKEEEEKQHQQLPARRRLKRESSSNLLTADNCVKKARLSRLEVDENNVIDLVDDDDDDDVDCNFFTIDERSSMMNDERQRLRSVQDFAYMKCLYEENYNR